MLDVHAPHGRLSGLKEFLIHLLTITVGLLIATQIESFVEWRHHVHLANEAREAMRAEIKTNLKDLRSSQPALNAWRKQVEQELVGLRRIQEAPNDPAAQELSISASASGIDLKDTAWRTAQSTGALAYMPYDEANALSRIYEAQERLIAYEQKPQEDASEIYGAIAREGLGTKNKKINAADAGLLAEPIGHLRIHLLFGAALYDQCIEFSDAYLTGRKPKENFDESLKN